MICRAFVPGWILAILVGAGANKGSMNEFFSIWNSIEAIQTKPPDNTTPFTSMVFKRLWLAFNAKP